jgi:hypothetical protein
MRTVLATAIVLLVALPAHAADNLGAVLHFERAAAKVWNAVRKSTPLVDDRKGYGYPAENKAIVDGAFFRAGTYGNGQQLQIGLPGEQGMRLNKVINFGPRAALRDVSVDHSWSDGTSLTTLKRPGEAPVYLLFGMGQSGPVSVDLARIVVRAKGRFVLRRSPGIDAMQGQIQEHLAK